MGGGGALNPEMLSQLKRETKIKAKIVFVFLGANL